MKTFIDPKGKFLIDIPIDWQYKNQFEKIPEQGPHSFEKYQKKVGAFQISCNEVTAHIKNIIDANHLKRQKANRSNIEFTEKIILNEKFDVYTWMAYIHDHFIMITFIYESHKREQKNVKYEIFKVQKSLPTFMFIPPEERTKFLNSRRFEMFMGSLATSTDLLNEASKNGSFIEQVVIIANRIDAFLRLSIILTNQLKNRNREIDLSLLFQDKEDRPISERKIYDEALNRKIISQDIFIDLEAMYQERNKVVHRYIITDLRTRDVLNTVIRYWALEDKISNIIIDLEHKQFASKTGIYGIGNPPDKKIDELEMKKLISLIRDKHGMLKLHRKIGFKI